MVRCAVEKQRNRPGATSYTPFDWLGRSEKDAFQDLNSHFVQGRVSNELSILNHSKVSGSSSTSLLRDGTHVEQHLQNPN